MKFRHAMLSILPFAALGACSGGAIETPMDPQAVAAAVENDLGMVCFEPEPGETIPCDVKADPGRSRTYADVRIQVVEADDRGEGVYEASTISVRQSEIDRGQVEKFVSRFGFSAEDLEGAIVNGDRITRGPFTLDRFKTESILIFD
ncbi:hypothetical protein T8S45_14115 [Blastomonas marina]|uniref:hypothetical protein n=1 Tax=Blastomonas marina TaxID=1867408 RepID=UPI002AC89BE8|nr:hypothetical protein [Blastomonas marina]WPZ03942.1 hypothetical protein T8S45_14115 [Blastomonas marina]